MSHKFFTLIHGGDLHIAPESKVVPVEAFSKMLDALQVLEQVKQDAEQYRQEVFQECEKLKEKAQSDGFEAGYTEWANHIAELESEIKHVRADVEKMVIPVALKAAKKIVNQELETSKTAIVNIIDNSLKSVAQHKNVVIYVNKKDLELVEKSKSQLAKNFEALEALSIVERADINPGGCVIETEGGIINAQIENQWLILERAFEMMTRAKPQAAPPKPSVEEKIVEEAASEASET